MSFVLPEWPAAAEAGAARFNAREYFEAHEDWEPLWLEQRGHPRDFWQGLIQLAAGMVKIQRGEQAGALRLLEKGLSRLEPLLPAGAPIEVSRLTEDAREARELLRRLGPGAIAGGAFPEDRLLTLHRRGAGGEPGLRLRTWPPLAAEGVARFDAGDWWESHESLEEVMAEAPGDEPLLYKGLIQAGSALHLLSRGRQAPGRQQAAAALRLLDWLSPVVFPAHAGVRLEAVQEALREILDRPGLPDPVPRPRLSA